jgi:protein-S-isoprenylcysteine O-methyltransferase Ste14
VWVLVPPPPLFAAAFFAGTRLDRVAPLLAGLGASPVRYAGIALIAAGALLIPTAPVLFLLRRTTIVPHGSARTLITAGPYRVTRNPMYLGMTLLYLGIALFTGAVWPLLTLALPLWAMHTKTIPYEEQKLEAIFGDEYRAYARRVRRWL